MKERPIIFSGDRVRAILEGRKTRTRRVMKYQLIERDYTVNEQTAKVNVMPLPNGKVVYPGGTLAQGYPSLAEYCPYGKVGDQLWVRETFYDDLGTRRNEAERLSREHVYYRADGEASQQFEDWMDLRWSSPIHMPRWASRITLEITSVRVERLQDISETGAIAEGINPTVFDEFDIAEIKFEDPECLEAKVLDILGPVQIPAKVNFMTLWDKINGKTHPWTSNPWVWVIEMKRMEDK